MSKDQPQHFPKSLRLLRSADFQRVSKLGKRRFSKNFVLVFAKQPLDSEEASAGRDEGALFHVPRIGITVSRKVGKAVVRNRIKRGVREWFRRHRAELPAGLDYLIIARNGKDLAACSAKERDAELKSLFEGSAK